MATQGRDKVDKSVSEAEDAKIANVAKCGTCNKEVVKDGVECEVCESWFHCKCERVAVGTYKALEQDKTLHWYCSGCSRGVVNTWKRLQEKQEALEKEVVQIKEEMKGLKIWTSKVSQLEKELSTDRAELKKTGWQTEEDGNCCDGRRTTKRANSTKGNAGFEAELEAGLEAVICRHCA